MSLLLGILTFLLVLISVFLVLVILAQRTKSDGGVGAALGGGMAEAAFGAESSNVLSKATQIAAVTFFVLTFALYLGRIAQHRAELRETPGAMPTSPSLMPTASEVAPPPLEGGLLPAPETITPATGTPAPVENTPPAPAPVSPEAAPANP